MPDEPTITGQKDRRKGWTILAVAAALAVSLVGGGVAGAQFAAQADADGVVRNLANDTCPNAADLALTNGRALSSTQTYVRDNTEPLSNGPDAYFAAMVPAGRQILIDVQAAWRPSLAVAMGCSGNDIDGATIVKTAFGGSTIAWTNDTGSAQDVRILLAGNRSVDFGRYFIEQNIDLPAVQDEVGVAAETAAAHFLPRRDSWTFVEGTTRAGFTEFITLLSESQQTITIQYMDERGQQADQTCVLAARTRVTLRVNADPGANPNGNLCADGFYGDGPGHDVAVRLVGEDEFRAERVIYHQAGVVGGAAASSASTGDHD
jgi:hypothetical protein